MARTVFIFGAGASAHAGAPLIKDFYQAIVDLNEIDQVLGYEKEFNLVIRAYTELTGTYAKTKMHYHENIEELFATFEMAKILGRLGNLSEDEVNKLPDAMRTVMSATIEERMKYRNVPDRGFIPTDGYNSFTGLLDNLEGTKHNDIALITFNYDYGLEYALHENEYKYDYCLGEMNDPSTLPLLKLHGSLNWARCRKCGAIIPFTIKEWKESGMPPKIGVDKLVSMYLSRNAIQAVHCNEPVFEDPFIIPPTWNKTQHYEYIQRIWARAAKELSDARMIVVIGYSIPPTDEFFKHLFALSIFGGPLIDCVAVVNRSSEAFSQLKKLAGDQLLPKLKDVRSTFENSHNKLWELFQSL
jgi:NAD-dependent SIR2 family protein deacetylase